MYTVLKSVVLIVSLLFLSSLSAQDKSNVSNGEKYTVKGTTTNYEPGTKVKFVSIVGRKTTTIDTTSIKKDGPFKFVGHIEDKCFAQILLNRDKIFLIADNYEMNVAIDKKNPKDYKLSGSKEINLLGALTEKNKQGVLISNPNFVTSYCDTVSSPFLAYIAMQYMNVDAHIEVYEKVENRFNEELPNNAIGKNLSLYIQQEKRRIESEKHLRIGAVAPNIDLPNPEGKNMSLEDLKGKVVLIDFWASWCGPCRRENPNVVRLYNKYKSMGFEVFSVSLDSGVERWKNAIEQDGLVWDYHVSDLNKWDSAPAKLYAVKSIPTTFLIDAEGKIIAKNLKGPQLEAQLKAIFGE